MINIFNLEPILFAQWIAENHYRLVNIVDGIYLWENDEGTKTTYKLYKDYLLEKQREA